MFGTESETSLIGSISRAAGLADTHFINKFRQFLVENPDLVKYSASTLKALPDGLRTRLLAALVVNETYFFRHPAQWHMIRDIVLPELQCAPRPLSIWCAGCATGEEAWSLAAVASPNDGDGCRIIATDISLAALAIARQGIYRRLAHMGSFRHMPDFASADFEGAVGTDWRAPDRWRIRVSFRHHNIIDPPPAARVDLIMCRNVLIYFTDRAVQAVMRSFASVLRSGGFLVLGPVDPPPPSLLFERLEARDAIVYRRNARAP